MDQSTDTNCTRMEYLSFPTVSIGLKDLAIGSAWLVDKLILEANQSSTYIDRGYMVIRTSPLGVVKVVTA